MRKLNERECTLGSVFTKVNEIVEKINNIPSVSKIETPKIENKPIANVDALNKSIENLNKELSTLKQNINKALNELVNNVNDNFNSIDKRIDNLENRKNG